MIELRNDRLVFSFPEIHPEAQCTIEFQRTLRIPDDNRAYPLPPGFGTFPLAHVDDYQVKMPETWKTHGGVFFPMYQAEAMWIFFHGAYPFAVKIAAGKVDAVTGEDWKNELTKAPQDYVVIPDQPWLDGFCVQKGNTAVRGHAPGGGLYGGGADHRQGRAWRVADRGLSHEGCRVREKPGALGDDHDGRFRGSLCA